MQQSRMPSPAILVSVLALAAALAVPALAETDAATSEVSQKKFKKLKKRVKALEQQSQQPGPQGPPGERGPAGENATNLFGYIRDQGTAGPAVGYGSGVTSVADADPGHGYRVTFNRSVTNCIVHATAGGGDPLGSALFGPGFALIEMYRGGADQVDLIFRSASGSEVNT